MSVYILIGIDPFAQPGINVIFKYNTLKATHDHVRTWLTNQLTIQTRLICGLKGDMDQHIRKYMTKLTECNYINFYGEYPGNEIPDPYEYKWSIYNL